MTWWCTQVASMITNNNTIWQWFWKNKMDKKNMLGVKKLQNRNYLIFFTILLICFHYTCIIIKTNYNQPCFSQCVCTAWVLRMGTSQTSSSLLLLLSVLSLRTKPVWMETPAGCPLEVVWNYFFLHHFFDMTIRVEFKLLGTSHGWVDFQVKQDLLCVLFQQLQAGSK